jgi:RNA recognition motif-containing protein
MRLGRRKTEPGVAGLSTSASCPIAREQPTITVTDRRNVVKNFFVGNLGPEVTHEELRRLFEAYGQVVQVHIIVDRDTGLPRGFAFVEMTNDAGAE